MYIKDVLRRGRMLCCTTWVSDSGHAHLQALADAQAIDEQAEAGESVEPLCGLPLAVKDSIDVSGYPTSAGTPALLGKQMHLHGITEGHSKARFLPV